MSYGKEWGRYQTEKNYIFSLREPQNKMKDFTGQSIMANYFRGIESVGSKVYFYEDRLIFKSHALNIQRGETEIKYSDIVEVKKRNTLFIVPNGMGITTKDGFNHKFVLNGRSNVIEFLNSKIG